MNIKEIIFFIIIVIIVCIMYNLNSKPREHLWVGQNPNMHPQCDHVESEKKPYVNNYNISNYSDAYDCYNKCIKDADCGYVGVAFDCYNNCFNNLNNVNMPQWRPHNTQFP
jgi:hypothetical protein